MHKLLLSLIISAGLSYASNFNAIAITVNDEPITSYDIERTMAVNKISQQEAVSYLIDKALYDQLVSQNYITADVFEINEYIEKLANANGMDVYAFKAIVKQEYPEYEAFENEAKNAVIRQKLVQQIVKGQLAIASDDDMQLYYEKNGKKYLTAKSFSIIQYISKNKNSLTKMMQNPLMMPSDVTKESLRLESNSIQPQLQYLLTNTNENAFTPVFTADKHFVTMFISKKEGSVIQPFESAKGKIFNDIMSQREQSYLKDHFEKQKLIADIKVLR